MKRIGQYFIFVFLLVFIMQANLRGQDENSGSILMVLDVQEHYLNNAMKKDEAKSLVNNINQIISAARPMDIVFIKANIEVLSISFKGIKVIKADNLTIEPTLYRKKNDMVFTKEEGSAFSSKDFINYLEENHISKVFLTGLFASECISATALNGEERGYELVLIEEGIAAKKAKKKQMILAELADQGIEIVNFQDFENSMK